MKEKEPPKEFSMEEMKRKLERAEQDRRRAESILLGIRLSLAERLR